MQVDATNLPDYNPTSDAIQLRPFEVLCEVRADVNTCAARRHVNCSLAVQCCLQYCHSVALSTAQTR